MKLFITLIFAATLSAQMDMAEQRRITALLVAEDVRIVQHTRAALDLTGEVNRRIVRARHRKAILKHIVTLGIK